MIDWGWIGDHGDLIRHAAARNAYLGLVSVAFGLLISLPVGLLCARFRRIYAPITALATVVYAIPSLALFVILIGYTGFGDLTIIIPLTAYTLSVLIPNVADGLNAVPDHVRQAAVAMGFGPVRRLVLVELPVAVPVVIAGLRIAAVSSLSLVSIGVLVGNNLSGLGQLLQDGVNADNFLTEIWAGVVSIVLLAMVADLALVGVGRLLTPWTRRGGPRRRLLRGSRAQVAAA